MRKIKIKRTKFRKHIFNVYFTEKLRFILVSAYDFGKSLKH